MQSRQWLATTSAVIVVALVGAGAWYFSMRYEDSRPRLADAAVIPSPTPDATTSEATTPTAGDVSDTSVPLTTEFFGADPFDPIGTCYFQESPGELKQDMTRVPCDEPHHFELVSHRTAVEQNEFPAEEYWDEVAVACGEDAEEYMGQPVLQWPRIYDSMYLIPLAQGWAEGDRHISCLITTTEPTTGPAPRT